MIIFSLRNCDFWPVFRQFYFCTAVMLTNISTAAYTGFHTVLMQQLPDDPEMDEPDLNVMIWIVSIGSLCTFPAFILGQILMDKAGRKPTFIASTLITTLGWLVAYFSQNSKLLILANSILGFGMGVYDIVGLSSISEFMEPRFRTTFSIATGYTAVVIVAFIHLLGWYMHWRSICLLMLVPCVLGLLIGLSWVESPLWLASQARFDEAESTFVYLRGKSEANTKEYQDMITREKKHLNKDDRNTETKIESNKTSKKRKAAQLLHSLLQQIKEKPFHRSMVVAMIIYLLYLASGSLLLTYYIPFLFKQIFQNDDWTFYAQIFYNASTLTGGFLNIIIISRIKIKTFLLISTCLTVLLNLSIPCYLFLVRFELISIGPVTLIVLLTLQGLFSGLGIRAMAIGLHAEFIPVNYRSVGICLSNVLRGIIKGVVIKATPYLFLYLGFDITFGIYSLFVVIMIVVLYPIIPETKGMTLEEIERFYER